MILILFDPERIRARIDNRVAEKRCDIGLVVFTVGSADSLNHQDTPGPGGKIAPTEPYRTP
jgi:hypothetical protein